jgi:hypothetical protein
MEQLPKIQLSPLAEQSLDEMWKLTNEGFLSGRVTKPQLVAWIILDFRSKRFAATMKKIRDDHFDELAHLRSLVKQAEEAKRQGREGEVKSLLSSVKRKSEPVKLAKAKPDEK